MREGPSRPMVGLMMLVEKGGARLRLRVSFLTRAILVLVALELLLTVLSLCMPWGTSVATGRDVGTGLEGLLPCFLLIPVFLQVGYLLAESSIIQVLCVVSSVVVGVFVVLVQTVLRVRFDTVFQPGFYLVFIAAGLALFVSLLCALEHRFFFRLEHAGKARRISLWGAGNR